MRIIVVSPIFAPYALVGANRTISLVQFLKDSGEQLTLFRNRYQEERAYRAVVPEPKGVAYIDVPVIDESNFSEMETVYRASVREYLSETREQADVAIISGGPFYAMSCAEVFHKQGISVILDFRDLWAHEAPRNLRVGYLLRRLRKQIQIAPKEREYIHQADAIVTVVADDCCIMKKHYRNKRDSIYCIQNGYDESRLCNESDSYSDAELPALDHTKWFYVGVFGKLAYYSNHLAEEFLAGLRASSVQGRMVTLLHIGEKEPAVDRLVRKVGMEPGQYIHIPSKDYVDGMRVMRLMDAFGLVSCTTKGALGTKAFDYIRLNKPVVVVENRTTALTRLFSSFPHGYVCRNRKQVAESLNEISKNGISELTDPASVAAYSRIFQNEAYIKVIKQIVGKMQ